MPRRASSSGSTTGVTPKRSISARPRRASGAMTTRLSSANTRSGDTRRRAGAWAPAAARVSRSGSRRSSQARRAARSTRSGSAANPSALTILSRPAARSSRPPNGSIGSPPASGSAIALTVKSRAARSSSMLRPLTGSTSTCHPRSRATTRHPPKVSESGKAAARPARPNALAAGATGPSTTTSRSKVWRPSSRSRTAPPTSHAGRPSSARRARRSGSRSGAIAVVAALHALSQPAGDLVVDGVQALGPLLGEQPVADQHGLVIAPHGGLRSEVDGDVVHAHGPDQRMATPAQEHVGVVGQRPPDAVAVADRDRGQRGRLGGHEAAPVSGALARGRRLDGGDVGPQVERGLEPLLGGVALERVQAVDGHAAAHEVEVGGGLAQGGRRVGGVHDGARMAALYLSGEGREGGQLLP